MKKSCSNKKVGLLPQREGAKLVVREDICDFNIDFVVSVLEECCKSHKTRRVDIENECPDYEVCVKYFDIYCNKLEIKTKKEELNWILTI